MLIPFRLNLLDSGAPPGGGASDDGAVIRHTRHIGYMPHAVRGFRSAVLLFLSGGWF